MEDSNSTSITYPAVPAKEIQTSKYLNDAVRLLAEYSWIYSSKNTEIFTANVLQKMPYEWVLALQDLSLDEQKQVPYNMYKEDWPSSLQNFIKQATALAVFDDRKAATNEFVANKILVPRFIKRGAALKKIEEVKYMAAVVWEMAQKYGCGTVLDIGSGLGCLDQVLHHNFGLKTIGIECIPDRTLAAKARISKGFCSKKMFHETKKIENTPECLEYLKNLLDELSKKEEICNCGLLSKKLDKSKDGIIMVGLHSCGNLAPDMMELFYALPAVKAIVFASCCYHQINLKNFPMSDVAKNVVTSVQKDFPKWAPCEPGLRLGCQLTKTYWNNQPKEEFFYRDKYLSYRAVFQCLLRKENLNWQKPRRHLRKNDISTFDTFVMAMFKTLSFTESDREKKFLFLKQVFHEKEYLFPYIQILLLLQLLLQPVWEGLVIHDRIAFFEEHSIQTEVFLMCDELISPRNVILCGIKT